MKLSTIKLFTLLLCLAASNSFGNASANLDQYRNGSASNPVTTGSNWVNGNAGQSNSHYMEGMSIAYRCVMSSLPTGTPITITFGYDVKHSDKFAIDYLTQYHRLEPHIVFGHPAEPQDPTAGTALNPLVFTTFPIPVPTAVGSPMPGQPTSSFNALPSGERVFTIYGGTITNIQYGAQANLQASQSEQLITITFTASSATAILAWGGHIGSRLDWGYDQSGTPNSAGGISGSPYHMRLKSWNLGNLGNTDRSLSANAVIGPPDCNISVNPGSQSVCVGNNFTITVNNSTGTPNFTYNWTGPNGFTSNTVTASASNSITISNAQLVNGGTYMVTVTDGAGLSCSSQATITVNQAVACNITQNTYVGCPGGTSTYSAPSAGSYSWSVTGGGATIQGSSTSQNVTIVNNSNGNACNGSYTVHLTLGVNGCSSTCSMPVQIGDQTAPVLQCAGNSGICDTTLIVWGNPSASDDCDPNPVVAIVSTVQNGNSITRTWSATDACGNVSTCSQTYTQINCGNEYCGLTQGAYGSYGGQNCQGQNTVQQLTLALATNLYIGAPGRSLTLTLADVNCIIGKLPGGTTPAIMAAGNLSCSNLHPLNNGRIANVLLAQTITLAFNMRWDVSMGSIHITDQNMITYGSTECGQDSTQNMVLTDSLTTHIPQSVITYLGGNNTVADLWQLASDALGGVYVPTNPGDPSLSDINAAIDAFNEGFDECRFLGGFFPRPASATNSTDLNSFGVYPNPFSSSTTISLSTDVANNNVKVDVVTVDGKVVATLFNGATEANKVYKFDFSSNSVAKAVYICRVVTDNSSNFKKFIMIK
jgi:hypothetical protein